MRVLFIRQEAAQSAGGVSGGSALKGLGCSSDKVGMENGFLDKPIDSLDLARDMSDRRARLESLTSAGNRSSQLQEILSLLRGLPDREFEQAFSACVSVVTALSGQRNRKTAIDRHSAKVSQEASRVLTQAKSA